MPEWLPVFPVVLGLFGTLGGIAVGITADSQKQNAVAISVVVSSFLLIGLGITMFQFTDITREECGVVGTNAEDAEYVCVEVPG